VGQTDTEEILMIVCSRCQTEFTNDRQFDQHILWCNPSSLSKKKKKILEDQVAHDNQLANERLKARGRRF